MRIKLKTQFLRFIISLSVIGLCSCGYHLRGEVYIPEQALPVYVSEDDGFHDLRRALKHQLMQSDVVTTKNNAGASTVISILSMEKTSDVISVDSLGRTSEVKLGLTATVAITIDKILYQKKIRVSKDVAFNPENILSYKKEEKILYDEMYADMSRLILLQLQAKAKPTF